MSTGNINAGERSYRYRRAMIMVQSLLLMFFGAWIVWSMTYVRGRVLLVLMAAVVVLMSALVLKNLRHLGETYTITPAGIRRDSFLGAVDQSWEAVVEIKRCRTALDLQCLKIIAATGSSITVAGDYLTDFDEFCQLVVQHATSARGQANWIQVD